MPEIMVRRLTAADGAAFRDIRLEGLEQDPAAFAADLSEEREQPLGWFVARLESAAVFGAFMGSELVGVAGFKARTWPSWPTRARSGACTYAPPAAAQASAAR